MPDLVACSIAFLVSLWYVGFATRNDRAPDFLFRKLRPVGSIGKEKVNVSSLANCLSRIRSIPFMTAILPKTPKSCRMLGITLVLIGLLPLLMFWLAVLNVSMFSLSDWVGSQSFRANFLINLYVLMVFAVIAPFVCNNLLRCGIGLWLLPKECKVLNCDFGLWVEGTR